MTLGFSTQINGKPNYFPEKIITGLDIPDYKKFTLMDHLADATGSYSIDDFKNGKCNPNFSHRSKLHTIREDKNNRWRAGMNIHMVINNRTKDRFQFAPVVKCVSIQEIEIEYVNEWLTVRIDGRYLGFVEKLILAFNDGFESIEHFKSYFNKDFRGKIIHWTDLKY